MSHTHRVIISVLSALNKIKMAPALGHCEDLECQSSNHETIRLFRCSIHCDRNLCLYHLNAHNVYYEEEKKQNTILINELKNNLSLYQTIFEKQISCYRELVHQASSVLLNNTSSLVPMGQIQPILEKLQQAIAVFHEEKIIIKCESTLDTSEMEKPSNDNGEKVVVRIPRIDLNTNNAENDNSTINNENVLKPIDEANVSTLRGTKRTSDVIKTRGSSVKRLHK